MANGSLDNVSAQLKNIKGRVDKLEEQRSPRKMENKPLSEGVGLASAPVPPAMGLASNCVAVAVLGSFLFGYQTMVLNTCAELIAVKLSWCDNSWQSDCPMSNTYIGLINAAVFLGAAAGAGILGLPQVFKLGARKQLVLSDCLYIAGGVTCAFAPNFLVIFLGRILSGLGLGFCAIAVSVYIAEISPRERRGVNCAMNGVGITVGILGASMLGLPQGPPPSGPGESLQGLDAWYWRFLLGFQVLPALLQAILFLTVFPIDPPSFLVGKGQVGEARTLLYKTYGKEATTFGSNSLNSETVHLEQQLNELVEASEAAKDIPHIRVVDAIFDPFLRCAIFLGIFIAAFQQLSGINALMCYANTFFGEGGIPASQLTNASTAMSIANVAASFLSAKVVDRLGRRTLLLVGSFCQALAMGALSICAVSADTLPPALVGGVTVLAFTLFVTTFSIGLGPITWLYLAEVYPMEVRGPALSFCGIINWLGSFSIVMVVKYLNLLGTCLLLFVICALGTLGVFLWVVETKGCSMEDSPLTPRSERSKSNLLSPAGGRSPKVTEYQELADGSDDVGEGIVRQVGKA